MDSWSGRSLFWIVQCIVFWACRSLDVTTIYRGGNEFQNSTSVECHARTNALGLPFIAPNGSIFEPEVGLTVPSCQIGLRPNCPWTSQGWEITGGAELNLPPLRLHHETVSIHTNGVLVSQLVPLFRPRFNFSLKTSTRGTARVILLTEADLNSGEMYVVDVVHNKLYLTHQTSSIQKCGRGRQYVHEIDLGPGIGMKKCHSIGNIYIRWVAEEDAMFQLDTTGGKLQLWRNDSTSALFTQLDPSPLRVKYIAVSTSEIERDWLLYLDGRVWSLVGISGVLKSPILAMDNAYKVCVSFFAYMDLVPGSGIKVSARRHDGSSTLLGQVFSNVWDNKKWILQRLRHDIPSDSDKMDIQILIEGLKGNPFATVALHGLMGCNPDDEEEIAVTTISLDRDKSFTCDVPTVYGDRKGLAMSCSPCLHGGECEAATGQCACPPGFVGDTCEEGCGANSFGRDCLGQCSGRKDGCKGLVLCVPILGCNCVTGYTGSTCDSECTPGWYGPNCGFMCGRCSSGASCDIFTGLCPEGCSQGYFPPLCNSTYSYLLHPPVISEVSAKRVAFAFLAGPENTAGSGEPRFYHVQVKEENSATWENRTPVLLDHSANPVNGFVEELRPGTTYLLRIILLDNDGSHFSNDSVVPSVSVTTTCQVPTDPIYEVKATWKTRDEFEVEWQYDPNDFTACSLLHFRVYLWEEWRRYLYNVTSSNKISVPNRSPFFQYSVQVQAVTTHGMSIASEATTVKTIQGAPTRVIRLSSAQVSPTELQVFWREPRSTFGKIKFYAVEFECLRYLACDPNVTCRESAGRLETPHTSCNVSGLHPHAQYSIRVAAVTVEPGPWTRIKAATPFAAPEAAPAPAEEPIVSRTSTSVEITWKPVPDCRMLHGFPLYYHYWLYMEKSPGEMVLVIEGNVTHPPVTFTALRPYTNFLVQVEQAVTGGLRNPRFRLEIPAKTRGSEPSVVRDLEIVEAKARSLTLKWNFPKEVPRDVVRHFVVVYMCVRRLACQSFNCPDNGTLEISETYLTLQSLQPYSRYRIKVAVYTGEIGDFSSLDAQTLTAPSEAAPRMNPKKPPMAGNSWIAVWWLPPEKCSSQHGPILGYRHRIARDPKYLQMQDTASVDQTNVVFINSTSVNFTMLPSYTLFRIEIALVTNSSDRTPWRNLSVFSLSVRTRPKVPDPVKDLVAYKRGETMVGLRWRNPKYLHGPIDSANIRTFFEDQVLFAQRVETSSCTAWESYTCHEIDGLGPNTTYTIIVMPFSSLVGEDGPPTNLTVTTIEGVPDPPSFVRLIRKTEDRVVIEWGHPNMTNGILRSFRISTEHVDSFDSDMCCDEEVSGNVQVFKENASYRAQVKGLWPASEYFIKVVSVTRVPSKPASMTVHTKPRVPRLAAPPLVIHESISNTTVDVMLTPAIFYTGGPIWMYFVMVCGHDGSSSVETNPILAEVKEEVGKDGFVALTLNAEELDEPLNITIGDGRESLGLYGFIRNQPLRPNTQYTIAQVVMAEYMGSRSFGIAESESFITVS